MSVEPRYISAAVLGDGFGSQFQNIIGLLLIAYTDGYEFVYNPITKIEHNYDNDPDYINKIEDLMNIKPYFKLIGDPELVGKPMTFYTNENAMTPKYTLDSNIDHYANPDALNKIRTMFWANKERSAVFTDTNKIHVAIHIRRMNQHDVTLDYVDPLRISTGNDYYLRIMEWIRWEYGSRDIQFHIYSQGDVADYACFVSPDTELHINTDLCKSFIEMVAADILVTAFSSLSYVAGLLSEGKVYYHNFWHKPRSSWIIIT
jgi:hypothetical protein